MSTPRLEPEKITIIEGPPPAFELALEPWVIGMTEGPSLAYTVRCLLRTNNGPDLVKRCRDAWNENRDVFLDYRTMDGLRKQAPILAVRDDEVEEGQVLLVWVRLEELPENLADQFIDDDTFDDDDEDDDDDDIDDLDLLP